MLSKVFSWEVILYDNVTNTPINWTFNRSGIGTLRLYSYYWANRQRSIEITHNGEKKTYSATTTNTNVYFWDNITIYSWDTYKITATWTSNSGRITLYYNYKELYKGIKIYSLKSIWEKLTGYLFGMLPDGTRRDGN